MNEGLIRNHIFFSHSFVSEERFVNIIQEFSVNYIKDNFIIMESISEEFFTLNRWGTLKVLVFVHLEKCTKIERLLASIK